MRPQTPCPSAFSAIFGLSGADRVCGGSESDMKRAAPSQEPLDVSSGDSSGSDSDQLGGKDKGGSASKAAAGAEGESSPMVC